MSFIKKISSTDYVLYDDEKVQITIDEKDLLTFKGLNNRNFTGQEFSKLVTFFWDVYNDLEATRTSFFTRKTDK